MKYKIVTDSISVTTESGVLSIPLDPANRHYQQFLDDVIEGVAVEGEDVVEPSYVELRAAEYPNLATQLDMQYWDNINGTTTWQDTIDAIKAKYPKTITGGVTVADVPAWVQEEADAKLFARQLSAYITAVARLEQYVLAEGRPEIREMQPTGETVFNEETGEMEAVMAEVVVQTAIDPLEATIEVTEYDEEGNPTTSIIENPEITRDNAERAEAQAVVDATPDAVKEAV